MKIFNWNPEKNHQLIAERGRSFEEAIFHIRNGGLVDDICHPNASDYPHQKIFIVATDQYAYLVPYVEKELLDRASEEGIPYQTLVSSIIHKYVSGSLRDIAANKKRQGDA